MQSSQSKRPTVNLGCGGHVKRAKIALIYMRTASRVSLLTLSCPRRLRKGSRRANPRGNQSLVPPVLADPKERVSPDPKDLVVVSPAPPWGRAKDNRSDACYALGFRPGHAQFKTAHSCIRRPRLLSSRDSWNVSVRNLRRGLHRLQGPSARAIRGSTKAVANMAPLVSLPMIQPNGERANRLRPPQRRV